MRCGVEVETEEATLSPDGAGSGGAGPEEVEEAVRLQAAESGGREGRRGRRDRGRERGSIRSYQLNQRSIERSAGIAESLERTRMETGGQRRK